MTIKASVYIATSLDGFIARANGALDWLTGAAGAQSDSDYGYQAFMDTVDVIVMGRNTFDLALTFDVWPYSSKKVVVLSHRLSEIPAPLAATVAVLSLAPNYSGPGCQDTDLGQNQWIALLSCAENP